MEKNRDQENFMETDDHMAKECYTEANISLLVLNKKKSKLCANLPSFKINRTAHRSQIDSINPKWKRNVLHLN